MVSIGIVVSDYRKDLTYRMLDRAKKRAAELQAIVVKESHITGALEAPLAAKRLLEKGVDGVVVLAVVLQGGTDHDVMVAGNAYRKLVDLSVEYGKPIGIGIIGPRVNREKAVERLSEYAEHAVNAAVLLSL